jgi:hypothetical protein
VSDRDLNAAAVASPRVPRACIVLALLLSAALPALSTVTGSSVGAFRMFTDLTHYHLTVHRMSDPGAWSVVPLDRLAPHLGRDARRVILPAQQWALGETNSELLAGGLEDIGRLVCELERDARAVEVTLFRERTDGSLPRVAVRVPCAAGAPRNGR